MKRTCRALTCAGAVGALYSGAAAAAYQWNFQAPGTKIAQEVSDLHLLMMAIILVIFVAVFGVMFYSIYAHRKSVGHKASQFHENTTVEVLWTIVPTLILIVMAWPATTHLLAVRDTSQADITIKATGIQWKWGYDYIKGEGEGINFVANLTTPQDQIYGKAPRGEHYLLETDNHLVVPVGKKVRMLVTAADVIHAWYVPALAVKQDAIPGFIRDTAFRANKEGIYRGQCAELCGKDHGFMPVVVEVVSQEKYTAWVGEQKKKLAAAGRGPEQDLGSRGAAGARREDLRRQLRGLPSGERQGRSGRVSGARRVEGRQRPARRQPGDRAERQDRHGDAGVRQAAFGHRSRRGDHLPPQRLGQQGVPEPGAAGRSRGGSQVTVTQVLPRSRSQ